MQNAKFVFIVSCGIAVVACSTTSSNTAGNNGDASGTAGDDGSNGTPPPGDDSGGGGNPLGDATITCNGMADCGGAGHACCFSIMTRSTMCVTGTCGMNYTQCVSQGDCPAGTQCIPSPLGMGVHYCGRGEGGAGDSGTTPGEAGAGDAGSTPDAVADGSGSSAGDGSSE